jgi:putative peptide zinc metalloprotease protein
LVNANPLLRYDGYYVLSDLWGVPNLHEQSREALRATATGWLTARKLPRNRWDASPVTLALYGIAAWFYRHFVVIMISWVVWRLLDGIGLNLVGALLVMFTLVNLLLATAFGMLDWIKELCMTGGVRVLRATVVFAAIFFGAAAFFQTPWPTYVESRVVATLEDMTPVYVEHAGVLVDFKSPGQFVTRGSEIARIESPELQLELIDTEGEVALLEQRSTQLRGRLVDDDTAASELATVIEELSKAQARLRILEAEFSSLVCHAGRDGILIPGERMVRGSLTMLKDQQSAKPLLSAEYSGCYVDRGTLLGWISQENAYEVTAYVMESDAELLSVGMQVVCRWDCELGISSTGNVVRIAPEPIKEIPEPLLGDQSIPYQVGSQGKLLPETPYYEVRIALAALPNVLSHQSLGTAHFATSPRTLYQSLQRYLNQNVRPAL